MGPGARGAVAGAGCVTLRRVVDLRRSGERAGVIDDDAPANYVAPSGTTAVNPFAPTVVTTAANGNIVFTFNFKDTNGNNLTLLNAVVAIDLYLVQQAVLMKQQK